MAHEEMKKYLDTVLHIESGATAYFVLSPLFGSANAFVIWSCVFWIYNVIRSTQQKEAAQLATTFGFGMAAAVVPPTPKAPSVAIIILLVTAGAF